MREKQRRNKICGMVRVRLRGQGTGISAAQAKSPNFSLDALDLTRKENLHVPNGPVNKLAGNLLYFLKS
jgi:hypothetical protein